MSKDHDIEVSKMMEVIRKDLILPEKAYFFDTTLRDGEQTHGISFDLEDKLAIAHALDELGIDVIEAGFPITSDGDFESCKAIAAEGLNLEVCGLARLVKADIDRCIDASLDSIHVFIATSDLHIQGKLKSTREGVLKKIEEQVSYAAQHFDKILFSAEDATRTDLDYLIQTNKLAVECGATRVNIPDTVGTISPRAYGYIIREIHNALPNNVRIAAHCHNDFGLAVANTISAFENGGSEAQTTILGLGERAGNASFEQTAMSLYALYGVPMNIKTQKIYPTAKLVESMCGGKVTIGRLTPLIGQNAFVHESGIHSHGMIANARMYEPISPKLLGIQRSDELSDILAQSIKLGKHSGTAALKAKIVDMGLKPDDDQLNRINLRIKEIGDKGHIVIDQDFVAIVKDIMGAMPEEEKFVSLEELSVMTGSITPTATVRLRIKKQDSFVEKTESAVGNGPIDASINAILKCYSNFSNVKLLSFNIEAITGGTDALGNTTLEVIDTECKQIVKASATHEDVVMSSVLAMINALNMLVKRSCMVAVE